MYACPATGEPRPPHEAGSVMQGLLLGFSHWGTSLAASAGMCSRCSRTAGEKPSSGEQQGGQPLVGAWPATTQRVHL